MATTPTHGIYFPVETDVITPLQQVFATLASSVDSAISGIAVTTVNRAKLAADVTRGLPFAISAGSQSVGAVPAADSVNVTVTFPAGRFSVAPIVTATSDSDRLSAAVTATTATTATIRLTNRSNFASGTTTVKWQAMQMASGNGAG